MKCVIMAGGFGTRLRPITANIPKPMVPIGNKPVMEHIIELLRLHNIKNAQILLYFQPEIIMNYFGDGSQWDMEFSYLTPTLDLGTAGSVKNAMKGSNEDFIVISGDVLTDLDLSKAIEFHSKKHSRATIVLTRVENPLSYGIVITADDGKITRFLEKPSWGEVFSDTINTGIYIINPEVMKYVPDESEYDFGRNLFPLLLKEKVPLYGYIAEGYWKDIGDILEYRLAHSDLLNGKIKVSIPGNKIGGIDKNIWVDDGAKLDFTISISDSAIIGKDTQIGANVRIKNSVIGNRCNIEEGSIIDSSIIWDDVYIGEKVKIRESIVGRFARIKNRAYLSEGTIVSDHCKIGEETIIKDNVKIWPYKVVEDGATLSTSLIWGERWSKSIFGRYGVTGLGNIEITPEFASKLGAAFGAIIGKHASIITSRDHHKASRMINRALMSGLLSVGVDVHDFMVTPIPVVRYHIASTSEMGGTHVRRSPYDPELLDIKFLDSEGMDISPDKEKAVERLFFREDFYRAQMDETGVLSFPYQGIDRYRDGLLKYIDEEKIKKARMRIVIDYAFGSASTIFPSILGELGVDVISLNAYTDETRITKTEQEFKRSLNQLSNIVKTLNADIGVLLDTGAEKVFLIDEKGDILSGDLSLSLIAMLAMKTHKKGKIAVPVTASRVIEKIAADHGFSVIRTKTLPRSLMEVSKKEVIIFGGETLGGYIFPEFQPAFDSMLAIAKILEMMASCDVRLHQLMRSVPESYMIREHVPCPNEKKGTIMRKLLQEVSKENIELIEGVKISSDGGWAIAIPDPDKPIFHLNAEGDTHEIAIKLIENYKQKIVRWQKE